MAENYLDERGRIFDIQRYSIHDGFGYPYHRVPEGLRSSLPLVL